MTEGANLDVMNMTEARLYTPLAFAAFKDATACFKLIMKHALKHNLPNNPDCTSQELKVKVVREWVDSPTDEKFTALHFATYHGNLELIEILINELGSDYTLKNCYGSSVMHIAAQGD